MPRCIDVAQDRRASEAAPAVFKQAEQTLRDQEPVDILPILQVAEVAGGEAGMQAHRTLKQVPSLFVSQRSDLLPASRRYGCPRPPR